MYEVLIVYLKSIELSWFLFEFFRFWVCIENGKVEDNLLIDVFFVFGKKISKKLIVVFYGVI